MLHTLSQDTGNCGLEVEVYAAGETTEERQ